MGSGPAFSHTFRQGLQLGLFQSVSLHCHTCLP